MTFDYEHGLIAVAYELIRNAQMKSADGSFSDKLVLGNKRAQGRPALSNRRRLRSPGGCAWAWGWVGSERRSMQCGTHRFPRTTRVRQRGPRV